VAQLLVEQIRKNTIFALVDESDNSDHEIGRRVVLSELGIQTIEVDLRNGHLDLEMFRNVSCVLHMAGNVVTASSDHSVNSVSTRLLIDALGNSRESGSFIFTSSLAVYDNSQLKGIQTNEFTKIRRPLSGYGRSKANSELIIASVAKNRSTMRTIIVRVPSVFGRGSRVGGLFETFDSLVTNRSVLSALNYPGRTAVVSVERLAQFLVNIVANEVSESPLFAKDTVYLPVSEVVSYRELLQRSAKAMRVDLSEIRIPGVIWSAVRSLVRILIRFEKVLPHFVHNKLWQFYLLASDGFYCEPTTTHLDYAV